MTKEPEADTILQPSLHCLHDGEWCDLILSEAESRRINVKKLRREFDEAARLVETARNNMVLTALAETFDEIEREAIAAIEDAGYPVWDDNDTFLIYPRGTELPEELP